MNDSGLKIDQRTFATVGLEEDLDIPHIATQKRTGSIEIAIFYLSLVIVALP